MLKKYNNIVEVLKNQNFEKGITYVLGEEEKYVPYKQLYLNAINVLATLRKYNINVRDELVLQVEDNETFLTLFWASIIGGIIIIPIVAGNKEEDILKFIRIWEKLNRPHLINDDNIMSDINDYANNNGLKEVVIDIQKNRLSIDEVIRNNNSDTYVNQEGIPECLPDDIAIIQFSSGSTGDPKGVMLTHENLMTSIYDMHEALKLTSEDSIVSWMPLTHGMGIIGGHLLFLVANTNFYLMSKNLFIQNPLLWLEKTFEHKGTVMITPNFGLKHILQCLQMNQLDNIDLSSVRLVLNGAEPISTNICLDFLNVMQKYNLKMNSMCPVYGLTEATLGVTFAPAGEGMVAYNIDRNSLSIGNKVVYVDKSYKNSVSCVDIGYPLANCLLRICDKYDQEVEENIIGHIQISGKNIMKGYYNDNEVTMQFFTKDGWLRTGDLGFLRNGRLTIISRAKDVIFVNGQNFYSHDLERIIVEELDLQISECAVCGLHNYSLDQEEVIVFVLYDGELESFLDLSIDIKKCIMKKIGVNIYHVLPINRMPKTSSGKLQRYILREQYSNGVFDFIIKEINELNVKYKPAEVGYDETENFLLEICKETFKIQNINIDDNFIDFGGNSLLLTQIHNKLEKEFPGKVKISDLYTFFSVRKLANFINEKNFTTVPTISLPEIYFNDFYYENEVASYQLKIDNCQYETLIVMKHQYDGIELLDIFFSIFVYLITEIVEEDIVTIPICTGNNTIAFVRVDRRKVTGFIELFKYVNILRRDYAKEKKCTLDNIIETNIIRDKYSFIPLIYTSRNENSTVKINKIFDFILAFYDNGYDISITIEYNCGLLKKEKIEAFIAEYINILYVILEEYIKEGFNCGK